MIGRVLAQMSADELRPIFSESDKIAFQIGNLGIAWYAIIILSGALLGTCIGYFVFAKRLKLDSDTLIGGITIGLLVGILGARLYYVLFNFQNMNIDSILDVFNPRGGGLAIHGAILAEAIFIPLYCKWKKVNLLTTLEIAMPLILLAQVVGRWGNFMNQEAFGSLVPFSGEIQNGVLTDAQLLEQREFLRHLLIPDFIIDRMYIAHSTAVGYISGGSIQGYYHPTFLYESVANLIGLTTYMIVRKYSKKLYVGDGICFYLVWYGFVRFFIELLRTDPLTIGNTNIRVAVVTSVIYFILGIVLFILRRVFKYRCVSCYDTLYKEGATMMLEEIKTPSEVESEIESVGKETTKAKKKENALKKKKK